MLIKAFLWARKSHIDGLNVFVNVEAFSKDLSLARLVEKYPYIDKKEWDFLEELDPDSHSLGRIGTTLKLPRFTH